MQNFFDAATLDILIRLVLGLALGAIIGMERVLAHKTAGMRTYAMVSLGAALFVVISQLVANQFVNSTSFDPLRMASQIIVGIGFLGAGLILQQDSKVVGLTTASGLWVSAGIGVASGFGLYKVAIIATVLALVIFTVLWSIEQGIKKIKIRKENE